MIEAPRQQNRAILVGTSYYGGKEDRREEVPGVIESLRQMRAALKPIAVVPKLFCNRVSVDSLLQGIERTCGEAQNGLWVYYVGHGLVSDNELCLSLSRTQLDRCVATSLAFRALGKCIAQSPAKKKVLVLDCCHAQSGLRTQRSLQQHLRTVGAYAIGAAGEAEVALAGPGDSPTLFTKHLVEAMQDPMLPNGDTFTMEHLGKYLFERFRDLKENDPRIPQVAITSEGLGSAILLRKTGPPTELYRALAGSAIGAREGAVLPRRVEKHLKVLGPFRQAELADILVRTLEAAFKQADDTVDTLNTTAAHTQDGEKIIDQGIHPLHRLTRRLHDEIRLNPKYGAFCGLAERLVNAISKFCQSVRVLSGSVGTVQGPFEQAARKYHQDLKDVERDVNRMRQVCHRRLE